MSDIIKLLPDSVANQIAAGEVIQRPASVVKELVENAVDAGASEIKIILKDAGRTLIQVVDNGCGMSATDARLAFERHSTSKITEAADLFALHTMGFRGEALASICAIAQVELRTMKHDGSVGTRIVINGSKVECQEPEACAPGSNMMVKNLFFNVPARRKFLKSDHVEMNNVLREFERLALVNPGIEFLLIHNDSVVSQLLKGSFKQRIIDLFGKSLDKQIVPVETETSIVRVSGFVGRPENARKRGAQQFFMVNGRNMRHPYFHRAVMQCYEQLIPSDEQPCYFLNFSVDPETIDVNIHPTKNEVKFENEQPIWQILVAAIKEALGKFNVVPSIDFEAGDATDIPAFNPNINARHELEHDTSYNPFEDNPIRQSKSSSISAWKSVPSRMNQDWEKLYVDFEHEKRDEDTSQMRASGLNVMKSDGLSETSQSAIDFCLSENDTECTVMQIGGRYILSPTKSGLMVIDQHRAHVRILYDRYIDLAKLNAFSVQRIIFPEIVELTASQTVVMESIVDEVNSLGFDIAYLGNNSWSINGVPSVVSEINPRELLMSMVENVTEGSGDLADDMRHRIALSMARGAAVKSGQSLTTAEMEHLMSDLFKLSTPNYTPDGKIVLNMILFDDIATLFA